VKELNERYKNEYPNDSRQLIEGVGMQSHNYIMDTPPSKVENGILNLLSAGVDLMITELDLFAWYPWNAEPTGSSTGYRDLRDRGIEHIIGAAGTEEQRNYWIDRGITNGSEIEVIQAEVFAEYLRLYKNYAASIDRVTFWGLNDSQSWRRGHNPLLWNSDFSPKDAFYAVSNPEGYLGVEPTHVQPIPASKVAKLILDYNDLKPAYKNGKKGGNLISEVAREMGPKASFNNEPRSINKGEKELSNPAYRKAVFNFLESHPALEDRILIMPPDTFFIDGKK